MKRLTLTERNEENRRNDGETNHISGNHTVDHLDERTGQFGGTGEEKQEDPRTGKGEDKEGFFDFMLFHDSERDAEQEKQVSDAEYGFCGGGALENF